MNEENEKEVIENYDEREKNNTSGLEKILTIILFFFNSIK